MTTNETKREQMKQKALEILKEMGVYSPYIEAYEKNGGTPWLDFRHTVAGYAYEYASL